MSFPDHPPERFTSKPSLCAKNHHGSLIRWPAQGGYYDMHPSLANNTPEDGNYRALVDLMVRLAIFSAGGRRVVTLLAERRAAGRHEVGWDGRDHGGRPVAWGAYFCRLDTRIATKTEHMLLVR